MMMSAPIACCTDMDSSGCIVRKRPTQREDAVAHCEHCHFAIERALEERALLGDLRECAERDQLEASAILYVA